MLVAYGPDGRPAIAEETPHAQLQLWSHERLLYCPNCRGVVHVRGGAEKRTQLHFAHQKGECAWSTEGESVRHMRGKVVLAQWLRDQFPSATVTLEERLPEPNRIADIFVAHTNGTRQAIEFQCAPLDIEEWRHRHEAYRRAAIIDTWIIGTNRREKQEAFIEAILTMAREVLFLDPQVTPPRTWLRWPINRTLAQEWQSSEQRKESSAPTLVGWVGRLGYGATLAGFTPLTPRRVRPSPASAPAATGGGGTQYGDPWPVGLMADLPRSLPPRFPRTMTATSHRSSSSHGRRSSSRRLASDRGTVCSMWRAAREWSPDLRLDTRGQRAAWWRAMSAQRCSRMPRSRKFRARRSSWMWMRSG